MRIISRRTLRAFWEAGHGDAEAPLRQWMQEASRAAWTGMADVKQRYAHASVIDAERIVFNIGGNKYRLVVKATFVHRALYVKFIGTHAEYDRIDVSSL